MVNQITKYLNTQIIILVILMAHIDIPAKNLIISRSNETEEFVRSWKLRYERKTNF